MSGALIPASVPGPTRSEVELKTVKKAIPTLKKAAKQIQKVVFCFANILLPSCPVTREGPPDPPRAQAPWEPRLG